MSGASDRRSRVGEPRDLGGRIGTANGASAPARPAGNVSVSTGDRGVRIPETITLELLQGGSSAAEPQPAQLSALEQLYRGELPRRPDRDLRQFGYEQISRFGSASASQPGLTLPDHVLSPGDEVIVDLTTDRVQRIRAAVAEDGTVALEGLVSLRASGMRFSEFEASLRESIGRVRQNFELSVGLGRVASVGVRVVGEAERPGQLDAGPRPTVLDALGAAGVRKTGSLRRVTVRRSDGSSEEVDLYAYLLGRGDAPNIRLAAGDTVSIPPIGSTVAVAGSVQRPGIFEIAGASASLQDAIEFAGGLTGFALDDQIQIERTIGGSRVLVDASLDDSALELRDGDTLLVGAVDGRLLPIVEIAGEVSRPGRFQHRGGMTVGDLVRLAGGLTVDAADDQAFISRVVGVPMSRNRSWDADQGPASRKIIVVDLERAARGDPRHDISLEPLDLLRVRSISDAREVPTVEIIGAARSAGIYELTAGMTVSDLIAVAGNLRPDAFREEAELVRRRRTDSATTLDVDRYRVPLARILGMSESGPVLQTGDRLIIRRLSRAEVRVRAGGQVRFPGEYVLPAGSRITDLLAAAGGLLDDGDLRSARFTRESVRATQLDRWSELAERTRQTFERNLETRVNSARSKEAFSARIQLEQVQATLERLRSSQATGRIVVPFTAAEFPTSQANLVLETGDALRVPRRANTISVQGHVFNPLTVVASENISANELIDRAGGVTEIADEQRIYVVRADGHVSSVAQKRGRYVLRDPLLPGDVVLVPPRPLSRDSGSVALDLLLLARSAGEAAALWNLATSPIEDGSLSIIDTPASPRSDSSPPAELLREFQR